MINIEDLTIKQLREISCMFSNENIKLKESDHPFEIGKKYLVRTVTMIQLGILKWVGPKEIVLENASWVADTGRFNNALKNGEVKENEPFVNDVIIGRGAICDMTEWSRELLPEVK